MGFPVSWAFGYSPDRPGGVPSRRGSTFGMVGANGSAAYADVDSGLAVAVMRNGSPPAACRRHPDRPDHRRARKEHDEEPRPHSTSGSATPTPTRRLGRDPPGPRGGPAVLDLHGSRRRPPHLTPLVAVWLDGALYFCTGAGEQKAVNLRGNPHVLLLTGCHRWDEGLDVVAEGDAVQVTDEALLTRLAQAWAGKWDGQWQFQVRDGAFEQPGGGTGRRWCSRSGRPRSWRSPRAASARHATASLSTLAEPDPREDRWTRCCPALPPNGCRPAG